MSFKPTFLPQAMDVLIDNIRHNGGKVQYIDPQAERLFLICFSHVPDFWGKTPAHALAFMESLLPANAFISAVPCMPGEAPRGDGVTVITIHFRYLDDTTTD